MNPPADTEKSTAPPARPPSAGAPAAAAVVSVPRVGPLSSDTLQQLDGHGDVLRVELTGPAPTDDAGRGAELGVLDVLLDHGVTDIAGVDEQVLQRVLAVRAAIASHRRNRSEDES